MLRKLTYEVVFRATWAQSRLTNGIACIKCKNYTFDEVKALMKRNVVFQLPSESRRKGESNMNFIHAFWVRSVPSSLGFPGVGKEEMWLLILEVCLPRGLLFGNMSSGRPAPHIGTMECVAHLMKYFRTSKNPCPKFCGWEAAVTWVPQNNMGTIFRPFEFDSYCRWVVGYKQLYKHILQYQDSANTEYQERKLLNFYIGFSLYIALFPKR